jgi:hypothetical protein
MSVNITWSLTQGGQGISEIVDHGNAANGDSTSEKTIYIRHDGDNKITDVGLYVRQISGNYTGSFTAPSDIAELLSWGDANTESAFGGILLNMNALTSFSSGWATYNDKSPTCGFVCQNGVGDSEGNAIELPKSTGADTAGEILGGENDVRFQMRIDVPADEDTIGIRQFEMVLRFSFTS